VEHQEQLEKKGDHSFPGKRAIDRRLLPTALWLGVREFRGLWLEMDGDRDIIPKERFQYLRNYRNESVGIEVSLMGIVFQPYLETQLVP